MNISDNILFAKQSLHQELQRLMTQVKEQVYSISKEQFLVNTDDQIIEHVYSKLEVIPLTIYRDRARLSEPQETRFQKKSMLDETIYVEGVILELTLPYSGDLPLWDFKPSKSTQIPPRASVIPDRDNNQVGVLRIKLEYSHTELQEDVVKKEIGSLISSIEQYLTFVKSDVEEHNKQLRNGISNQVRQRRAQLGIINDTLQKLDIPVVKREGAPDVTELPIHRKLIEPLSQVKKEETEYGISDSNYALILSVIRHVGRSFERTPATFNIHDEEGLRDILLAFLNTYFNGRATGETFRKKGKTDICIEEKNRAAFVAECKLWNGEKALLEAMDQLLSYLTWRDVKTALIIFNKDVAGFKQIQEKVLDILKKHSNYINAEFILKDGEWYLRLHSKEDSERLITVQVFLFNLYSS